MGEALNRGVVLVMSLWDDSEAWKELSDSKKRLVKARFC